MNRRVLAKVPASTANLGPGFDTLGMALSLYAWIEMAAATDGRTRFELHGDQLSGIPTDKHNLIYKVAQLVFEEAGVSVPDIHVAMYTDIPLTRGLGSSASAIVGALFAANALIGNPLSGDRLFQIATKLEGHPDNVGASIFGGIVVTSWDGEHADCIRIEPGPELEVLVAIPSFQLSTEKARHALPKQFGMADTVFNVGRSSLLTAALATRRYDVIRRAMQDRLHQPYRAALIPGMAAILDKAADYGALGAALSGAGPTMLALVEAGSSRKQELERFLHETFAAEGITAETLWLKPALAGPEMTATEAAGLSPSLMDLIKGEVRA